MNDEHRTSRPTTVDETIAIIRRCCRPLEPESTALDQALGRVLRVPVLADSDQPSFDRSSVDGYAVRLDDASTSFQVTDRIRAGEWKPRNLLPGEAVQIATGGAVPGDGLQVVMKEEVQVQGDRIALMKRDTHRNIRFRGEDARAGQVLVEAGITLSPGALALMASVGWIEPSVTRLPRVFHLATGSEIVAPDQKPEHGQIRDSNSTLVRAFLEGFGIRPRQLHVPEDQTVATSRLRELVPQMERVDLLLISGGASVGDHDFTRALLRELGYTLHVSSTTTRPGKPLVFGASDHRLAFGLPGNPLAHFVCLRLYVAQALWGFSGARIVPEFGEAPLAHDFDLRPNPRETLWPAQTAGLGSSAKLTLLRWQSSGDLTALSAANALVRIPPNQESLSRGVPLSFLPA